MNSYTGNCGLGFGDTDAKLAIRYNGYRSGDSTETTINTWQDPDFLSGNTTVIKSPVCRN